MEKEKINKATQILTEHLKNKKNILILGEGHSTGKSLFQGWMNFSRKIKE